MCGVVCANVCAFESQRKTFKMVCVNLNVEPAHVVLCVHLYVHLCLFVCTHL